MPRLCSPDPRVQPLSGAPTTVQRDVTPSGECGCCGGEKVSHVLGTQALTVAPRNACKGHLIEPKVNLAKLPRDPDRQGDPSVARTCTGYLQPSGTEVTRSKQKSRARAQRRPREVPLVRGAGPGAVTSGHRGAGRSPVCEAVCWGLPDRNQVERVGGEAHASKLLWPSLHFCVNKRGFQEEEKQRTG